MTGRDLISVGASPAPGLGALLKELLELVLEDPSCNEKQTLLEAARSRLADGHS